MATVPAARTPQVAQTAVRRDKRAGTELEAAAGSEHAGVHGVVPDRVEESCHGRLREMFFYYEQR
jgi:hypothetical protein